MKLMLAAIALGATALAVPPVLAAPAASQQSDARYAKALELARLLNSSEQMVDALRTHYHKGIEEGVRADPQANALEKRFPGFFKELADVTYPFLQKLILDRLPDLWARQASYLAQDMTLPELDQAIAFYGSPAGRKLIDAISDSFEGDTMRAEMRGNGLTNISGDSVATDIMASAPTALKKMSKAEQNAMMAFADTPGGRKMARNGPKLAEISAGWMNDVLLSDPAFKNEVMSHTLRILERRQKEEKK